MGKQTVITREGPGRPKVYECETELYEKCLKYFERLKKSPVKIKRKTREKGKTVFFWDEFPRAPTLSGLCEFIGVHENTWRKYEKDPQFMWVTTRVRAWMYDEKFQGAAVNIYNANIIAQELGLKSRVEHSQEGETLEEFLQGLEEDEPNQ